MARYTVAAWRVVGYWNGALAGSMLILAACSSDQSGASGADAGVTPGGSNAGGNSSGGATSGGANSGGNTSGGATSGGANSGGSGGASGATSGGTTSGGASGAGGTSGSSNSGGAGGVGPPGDFATRCADPGVVRCVGFDSNADIAGKSGDPTGITAGATAPAIDSTVTASGAGSLKFTVPANAAADTSGSYWANFSDDLSVQFDSGEEFFVQWRQRFGAEFLTTDYSPGEGWKQVIIGEGSRPGDPAYSCTTLEVVTVNSYQRGFPEMYHSCGVKDGQYEGFEQPLPGADYWLQNAVAGCTYHNPTVPPCVGYKPDQWMTFQVHIKIGTWYKNDNVYHHDSTVQLWVAEEGKPSELVIDLSPGDPACAAQQVSQPDCHTGYDLVNDNIGVAKYGQVWLLPYNTNRVASSTFPATATWYDELIVSRTRIADPAP